MTKDPWLWYGMPGALGFVLGWGLPGYLLFGRVSYVPIACGILFFAASLVMRRYFRPKK